MTPSDPSGTAAGAEPEHPDSTVGQWPWEVTGPIPVGTTPPGAAPPGAPPEAVSATDLPTGAIPTADLPTGAMPVVPPGAVPPAMPNAVPPTMQSAAPPAAQAALAGATGAAAPVPAGMTPTAPSASTAPGTPAGQDPRNLKGLSSGMVMLILTLGTTAVAFADRYLNNNLTWYTGVTFVALCTICALFIRRADRWMAVFWAPLAFLVALMISGQPEVLRANGNLLIREASLLFSGLAFNAPWIFGGTIVALLVVLVRRPIRD